MIAYQVERFGDVIIEITPMFHDHYDEIATDKEVKPLDPDFDRYLALEDQGMLRIFTARENGQLIGYFVSLVHTHLHYQQTMMALNDIMYVTPGHRGSTVGYRLMKMAMADLKNLGADVLIIHMKCDYPFRPLLKRLGFHLTEENWECVL